MGLVELFHLAFDKNAFGYTNSLNFKDRLEMPRPAYIGLMTIKNEVDLMSAEKEG